MCGGRKKKNCQLLLDVDISKKLFGLFNSTRLDSIRFYFRKSNRSAVRHMYAVCECASIDLCVCTISQVTHKTKKTVSHTTPWLHSYVVLVVGSIHNTGARVLSNTQHQKAFSISFPFIKSTSCVVCPLVLTKIWLFESGAPYTLCH